jgi:hypothetical protein
MAALKSIKDVRNMIGKKVYWDDPDSKRYYGLERSGILTEVIGKNICVSGNWLWRTNLKNLRDCTKEGSNVKVRG